MLSRPTALITGGSSGIGYELAKCFARDRYTLVLVARTEETLRGLADELERDVGTSVMTIAKDLSQPSAPEEIFRTLQQAEVTVDVLVNNAGFGTYGPFAQQALDGELNMIQVNVVSLTHLTGLLVPEMVRRGRGKILNVASTAAFQPGPLMAVYYATKAYVLSFSEALANELRGSGVSVTALCPGPTQTKFQERAGVAHTRLMSRGVADAQSVARAGYRGLMRGQAIVIPGARNRLLALAVRLFPRGVVTQVVRGVQERRR